jgi:hypothetical protein
MDMPMNKKDFEESIDLRELKEKWVEKLKILGEKLGFACAEEVATNGGRVDLVWFHKFRSDIPYFDGKLPVVGFEIEASWRTRKHIKGDLFNLLELSPACGVILFLSEGFKEDSELRGNVEAAKRYVGGFKGICRIVVLTEKEIEEIFTSLKC